MSLATTRRARWYGISLWSGESYFVAVRISKINFSIFFYQFFDFFYQGTFVEGDEKIEEPFLSENVSPFAN